MPTSFAFVDQLGDGVHLHLCHHATAMDLDRLLGDAQDAGDLFVEPSRENLFHHLALPGRQPRHSRVDRSDVVALFQCCGVRRVASEIACNKAWESIGLSRKSTAPFFMATTLLATSPGR
jgi:hypothetical protein